jgi:sulfite reductase (ferredoxin)
MNGCGQHTIANIGFQGMTLKAGDRVAPATQILLGGGVLHNGKGRFADKVLKTPSKRVPEVLRWLLDDFTSNTEQSTLFTDYYDQKGADYFYQNLKQFSSTDDLVDSDFIDWGNESYYKKAIGVGECAGVTIDLVQTLIFDAEESFELAQETLVSGAWSDSIYHSYATQIRAAKALLTKSNSKINTHESIINSFDDVYPEFKGVFQFEFAALIRLINTNKPTELFAKAYRDQAKLVLSWIKDKANEN